MKGGFLKLQRGDSLDLLLERDHKALALITWIAVRAWYSDEPNILGFRYGQAALGDWKDMGFESEKEYRCTKKRLAKYGLAAFQGVRRGTIATLLDSRVFSLRDERPGGGQKPSRSTGKSGKTQNAGQPEGDHGATNQKSRRKTGEGRRPPPPASIELKLSDVEVDSVADALKLPPAGAASVLEAFNRVKSNFPEDVRSVEALLSWAQWRAVGKAAVKAAKERVVEAAVNIPEPPNWRAWAQANRPNFAGIDRHWHQLDLPTRRHLRDAIDRSLEA